MTNYDKLCAILSYSLPCTCTCTYTHTCTCTFHLTVKDAQRRNGRARTFLSATTRALRPQPAIKPLPARNKPDNKPLDPIAELRVRRSKSLHASREEVVDMEKVKSKRRTRTSTLFYTDVTSPLTTEKEVTPLSVTDKKPEELLQLLKNVCVTHNTHTHTHTHTHWIFVLQSLFQGV